LSVVTTATLFAYSAIHPLPAKIRGSPAEAVIAVAFIGGFATVGALLGWKRPANPIGWLMCGTALSYTAGGVGQLLLFRFPRMQTLGNWLGWIWLLGIGLVAFVLLLFPTGALPSRRWRPVAWAAAAGLAGWVLGNAFAPVIVSADSHPANPFGSGGVAGKLFLVLAPRLVSLGARTGLVRLLEMSGEGRWWCGKDVTPVPWRHRPGHAGWGGAGGGSTTGDGGAGLLPGTGRCGGQ
jgi:hypothetical protein